MQVDKCILGHFGELGFEILVVWINQMDKSLKPYPIRHLRDSDMRVVVLGFMV